MAQPDLVNFLTPRAEPASGAGRPRPRVLVIDDDPDARILVDGVLEGAGFDVFGRPDGVSALEAALTLQPAVVVLDWVLPGRSGLEVCTALRARRDLDGVAVLMLSGRGSDEDVRLGYGAGADRYLVKPIVPAELVRHVRDLAFA